jgi:hypothetical protein
MPFDCMPPNRACRRFESEDIAKQGAAWDIVERFRTNLAEALNGGARRKPWHERRGKTPHVFAPAFVVGLIPACRRSVFRCPANPGAIPKFISLPAQSRWRRLPSPPPLLSSPRRLSPAALFSSVWPSPSWRRASASRRRTPWRRWGRRPCAHCAPLKTLRSNGLRSIRRNGLRKRLVQSLPLSPMSSRHCLPR